MIKNTFLITTLGLLLSACGGSGSSQDSSNSIESVILDGQTNVFATEEQPFVFKPSLLAGGGNITFSVQNAPGWLKFDTTTGALSGTPDDDEVNTYDGIIISASNSVSRSSLGPISLTVNGVNDTPQIDTEQISFDNFQSSNQFTIDFSDDDNADSELKLFIESQPQFGIVEQDTSNPKLFYFTVNSVEAAQGDSFSISLIDPELAEVSREISMSFSDETPANIVTIPGDGALNAAATSSITITSDDSLNESSVTYISSGSSCSGSIQVSQDSFSSCLPIAQINFSELNTKLQVILSSSLQDDSEYKIKLTKNIENVFSLSQAWDSISSFKTANGLLITEVSECYYNNTYCWFEIYNPTSSAIDLSSYSFKSVYLTSSGDYKTDGAVEFSLPSVDIQPGQYVVVRSDKNGNSYTSNSRIVFAHESGSYPYWSGQGYIDLLSGGVTQDFISFGFNYTPTTFSEWSGSAAVAPNSEADSYGSSIGRDGNNRDTNGSGDWNAYDYASMGGANDVTCNDDADQDGIPDCSEEPGSTYAGLPLYDWGARTGQKDIFIELDYMDGTNNGAQSLDEGILPRKEALQKVVDVFAEQGIAVHFDVGDLYDNAAGLDPSDFDLGGGQEVPFIDGMTFSTTPSVYDYKVDYFDYSRFQIFHYLLFVNTQNGSSGSSGLAEINGNDLIVSLGEWGLNSNNESNTNRLINFQASTLMHELGHNLGLLHGGNENDNNKPNYFSIMNYLYQLNGLSEIGNNEGDRYYDEYFNGNANCDGPLTNPSSSDTFIMDFSHGVSAAITKNSANETLGLGQLNSSEVDFNCDGDVADTAADTGQGTDTWTDYDDWGNINLDFRNYFSGNQHGLSLVASSEDDLLIVDKVGNDRAPIAQEYSPSPEFFEKLKEQMNQ